MTENTQPKMDNGSNEVRTRRVLKDFVMGAATGLLLNVVIPEERDLDLILLGSLGVLPVSNLMGEKYVSKSERIVGSVAAYAGAVVGSITYQLSKY